MGTNFYTTHNKHIGKRSAAGLYCWDCKISLHKKGEEFVHISNRNSPFFSNFSRKQENSDWYEKCPKCGKSPKAKETNAAFKELGFSTIKGKQTGVSSCCSFTWAINPKELKRKRIVKDEYNRIYTMKEFQEELEFCPIQFYHMIGEEFC